MPRRQEYTPHPFVQLVATALDYLIEAQSSLLQEFYYPKIDRWEMPQDDFEAAPDLSKV